MFGSHHNQQKFKGSENNLSLFLKHALTEWLSNGLQLRQNWFDSSIGVHPHHSTEQEITNSMESM